MVVWTLVIPCSSLALPRIDEVSWLDFSQCRGPVTPRVTSYGPECFQVHHHLHHHDHLDQLQTPVTSSWKAGQRLAHLAGSTRISTSKPRVGIRRGGLNISLLNFAADSGKMDILAIRHLIFDFFHVLKIMARLSNYKGHLNFQSNFEEMSKHLSSIKRVDPQMQKNLVMFLVGCFCFGRCVPFQIQAGRVLGIKCQLSSNDLSSKRNFKNIFRLHPRFAC